MSEREPKIYNEKSYSKGIPEDPERCIETVWHEIGWMLLQCSRKRGYGKDGLYCKQHAKMRGELE